MRCRAPPLRRTRLDCSRSVAPSSLAKLGRSALHDERRGNAQRHTAPTRRTASGLADTVDGHCEHLCSLTSPRASKSKLPNSNARWNGDKDLFRLRPTHHYRLSRLNNFLGLHNRIKATSGALWFRRECLRITCTDGLVHSTCGPRMASRFSQR